jgi:hypothetical protein
VPHRQSPPTRTYAPSRPPRFPLPPTTLPPPAHHASPSRPPRFPKSDNSKKRIESAAGGWQSARPAPAWLAGRLWRQGPPGTGFRAGIPCPAPHLPHGRRPATGRNAPAGATVALAAGPLSRGQGVSRPAAGTQQPVARLTSVEQADCATQVPQKRFFRSAEDSTPDRGRIFSTNTILVTLGTVGLAGRRRPSSKDVCRFDREGVYVYWHIPVEGIDRAVTASCPGVGGAGDCATHGAAPGCGPGRARR